MRNVLYLSATLASGLLALAAGCGSADETTGAGGAAASTSATTTSSSTGVTTSSSSTTTSTSSGATGDGNDTFDTAEPLELGASVDGDLEPTGDVEYFAFDGKKGQALAFFVLAQGSDYPFDPDTVDTVLTLYDDKHTRIAENNDRVPTGSNDSELFTILPADGTYYLRLTECWTWAQNPNNQCAGTAEKANVTYTLSALEFDPVQPGNVVDTEGGDDAASAQPMTYAPAQGGGYYLSIVWGTFDSAADVDVFSLSFPADAQDVPPGSRALVNDWLLRPGIGGTGSTSATGHVYLTTQADPATKLAEVVGTDFGTQTARLWPPLDLSQTYLLWVEHPQGGLGANDFYFALHGTGYGNPLEIDDVANDTVAGAEVPEASSNGSFYVEGDLGDAGADIDHWSIDVTGQPAGAKVYAYCTARRAGSGLRGLTPELLAEDGAPLPGATDTESAVADAVTPAVDVPPGASTVVLKMSAASQAPDVTSAFYRCGVHFQ